ncbi:GntR family transcriptional regulator [Trueperella sp. LYQ143]|uniref:GntR family transcriptional regulator n=1 Tax=unclassified Trueperella TaxID=2630174 RepID=UPI003983A297
MGLFEPEITVNRSSTDPLHVQISAPIERAILDGAITPGTRIENEVSMAQRLNVSRPTARRALQTLVENGLLLRRRGVGTVVAPRPRHLPAKLPSLHEDLVASGHTPTTEVLQYNFKRATEAIAEKLDIQVGDQVVELERLRKRDGVPVAILYNWLPLAYAPARELLEERGLYQLIRDSGIEIAATTQSVGAERPDRREAQLLAISTRQPVLTIDRTAFDPAGAIIEWGLHCYRGDAYRYESTVVAHGHKP